MRLGCDSFAIRGIHGKTQSLEMAGKCLFENQQEFAHKFTVIFDEGQEFSEINDCTGHVIFLLLGGTRSLGERWPGQPVNFRTKKSNSYWFGNVAIHSNRQVFFRISRHRMCRHSNDRDMAAGDVKKYLSIDRKSTRLNSSHQIISYAVFCLKKNERLMDRETMA